MLKVNIISDSTYTVQGHGVHTAFLSMVEGLKDRDDVSVMVNSWSRGHHITHIHTFGPLGLYHAIFGSGKKVISAHVIPKSLVGSIKGSRLWLPLMKIYLKFFYNRADLIAAVSQTVLNSLRLDLKVKAQTVVLYNGIPMTKFAATLERRQQARHDLTIKADLFVVMGNGQIQPRKRFDIFVAVAKKMPDLNFIWVGGAPFGRLSDDFADLQQMITNAPDNVSVTGVIDYEQVQKYLSAADVFWLPSAQENHPMAVLEAAGAGLPIVLRDLKEYDDSFGQNAIRGDDTTFVSTLRQLQTNKTYYRQAAAGSKRIAERFDITQIIGELLSHYERILK